jgi:hypothetical protein
LGTGGGNIDNRQAAVAESDPGRLIGPDSAGIRTPVRQPIGHRTRQLACIVVAEAASEIEKARYATHGFILAPNAGRIWSV